jgi:TRAP-type mannitol/chloroaromatic compound transport system permease small subunit
METLVRISLALERVVTRCGKTFSWFGLLLVLIVVFDVVTRAFSQTSIGWLRNLIAAQQEIYGSTKIQELEWHFHTALFMFAFGWAYFANSHVRIDILVDKRSVRVRWWIELVGLALFALPLVALLLYFGCDMVVDSWNQNERSNSATGLSQRWIIRSAFPAGALLLLMAVVALLLRKIVKLFGPRELQARFPTHLFKAPAVGLSKPVGR